MLTVNDSSIAHGWNWVDLVLETYGVQACPMYASGRASFLQMRLVDTAEAPVTPAWTSSPYIDGWPGPQSPYMSPEEGRAFTACCGGSFELNDWPNNRLTTGVGILCISN